MATTQKALNDKLREKYLTSISQLFNELGEEVLRTGANEIALPCCDEENNDKFVVVTIKVPTGSRDGDLYDGYSVAEEYQMKQAAKIAKAKKTAEEKEKKKARDAKQREQAAEIRRKKEVREG